MKIRELFRSPVDRQIAEVIKVNETAEDIVAAELDEYVVTDRIRQALHEVLETYQETVHRPGEQCTVWISGFFGSGKSSFAKVLGYLLENPVVQGRPAAERLFARLADDRLKALLATIHTQAPTLTVSVDLSTSHHLLREGESIALPLYRALLERLGYSRNFALAQLEFDLESEGLLETFEAEVDRIAGRPGAWQEKRRTAFAVHLASQAMHRLRTNLYSQPESLVPVLTTDPVLDNETVVDRMRAVLGRRAPHARRLLFVVDEVGQYVARSPDRVFGLMGFAHAVQRQRGRIWLVVTSQEKLEDVVENLEGTRIELPRLQDRFPITVDLVPSDIEEVVARRLLDKNAAGAQAVRALIQAHRNRLLESTRLDSPFRQRDYPEEKYVSLYPLLPYQVELFIDAVSAHRARGGIGPQFGGSNRTLIKLTQQLLVNQRCNLAQRELGALATVDMAYDLLESIIPTSWQGEIHRVAERHGADGLPTRVAKAIALLDGVRNLPLTVENLAALLHPAVDAESLRPQVGEALQRLVQEEVVRRGDGGYKLQSPEEKRWEQERQGIELKQAVERRLLEEALSGLLGSVTATVEGRRTFRVRMQLDERPLSDGELTVVLVERLRDRFDEVRERSRERGQEHTLFWAFEASSETRDAARELHRSREMIRRYQGTSGMAELPALLAEEQRRQERYEKELRRQLEADLLRGELFFRGSGESPRGGDAASALRTAFQDRIPHIYPHLGRFAAPIGRQDPVAVLKAESLEGLSAYLHDMGVLRDTPTGPVLATEREPLATVLAVIRERASYGQEATGRCLEDHFTRPPYGAPVEAVQLLVAALVRAGLVEAVHQGVRLANPRDARLERVFATLPAFRAATFVPQREVDADMRARVAARLQEWTGTRAPLATEQLAAQLREAFRRYLEPCERVRATLLGLGLPVPESLSRLLETLRGFASATAADVIKSCDETWADLVEGCRKVERWSERLDDAQVERLRQALRLSRLSSSEFGPQGENLRTRLADLLADHDLAGHVGEIESLAAELARLRQETWLRTAEELNKRIQAALQRLRAAWAGRVDADTLKAALAPLADLRVDPAAGPEGGPAVEVLEAWLAGLDAQLARVQGRLEELAEQAVRDRVVQVRVQDLYDGVITSLEELEVLLERIRQAAEKALAEGRYFRLR